MKIFHIIDSGGLYGAEMMLLYLMEEQAKMGMQPVLCSIGEKNIPEKPLEAEAIRRGLPVNKFRMFNGPNFIGAWQILKYAHREHCSILHTHGYKANILFGFIPKKVRKIPHVSTLHGWTSTNGWSKIKLYEWLDAKSLAHIDSVVLVSNAMLINYKIRQNKKRINLSIIHNGIPPLDYKISSDLQNDPIINYCNKGFTIGSIGRLSKEKGYKILIEAVDILIKNGLQIKLIILGEGPDRKSMETIIGKLNLNNYVALPGYVDNARDYIKHFDIFALSSLTEGFPITILEAMQAARPIIAPNVGSINEILDNGNAGIVIDHPESQDIADAISLLYNDKSLCSKLAEKAKSLALSKYTCKTMTLQYKDLYEKLL